MAVFAYASWIQSRGLTCIVNHTDQASSVHIINTEIVQNAAIDAVGGLGIRLSLCRKYTIQIRNVTMSGNILGAIGEVPNIKEWWQQLYSVYGNALAAGNLGIMIAPATPYHSISIEDSTFSSGVGRYGGAILIYTLFPPCIYSARHVGSLDTISLSNVTFTNNTADFGGAMWIDCLRET